MSTRSKKRTEAVAAMGAVMAEFMARAVLFQDAVAKSGGLNSTDLQCVGLLLSHGPATPGELAARSGLTSGGAITALVDRLERAGYVTRARDPQDRRRVIVSAVEEVVLERVGPAYAFVSARWEEHLATLSDEQLTFATDLLARAAEINREAIEHLRPTGA